MALRENVAFVPGQSAYVDGRGGSSMRLNFSASTEEEIDEGIRRIGQVVWEQVELYETLTGRPTAAAPRRDRGAEETGDVVPLRKRAEGG